uniref:Uncharacterized protein n=1 Tax=viral metagenome TaxID=1070528 RepID=A0A6C0CPR1_9ZZZZ
MASVPEEQSISLQLGDIIEITSPSDDNLNEKQFFIKYLDKQRIDIMERDGDTKTLLLNNDGTFQNESIESIAILSRAESPSYARQHGLLPGKWIDIHFGGDIPAVITGNITALDEDQIEILYLDNDEGGNLEGETIYIDFAYKGIPENIPIEKIVLREPPQNVKLPTPEEIELSPIKEGTPEQQDDIADEMDDLQLASPDGEAPEPEPVFKERVRNIILAADQIQFGDKLAAIQQVVEVPEDEKRFGIDKQTTDILNELLSDIPNAQRTQSVLNNIHRMIERFKQLRTEFSKFDHQGNAMMPEIQGADYKPLIESLKTFNQKLYWLLPVVKNKKKVYNVDQDAAGELGDIDPQTLAAIRVAETEIIGAFKNGDIPDGQNGYDYLTKNMNSFWTPFEESTDPNIITTKEVKDNITAVVDNLGDFYSSVAKNQDIVRKRFLIETYNLGINTLEANRIKGGGLVVKTKPVTKPDTMQVKSLLSLPRPAIKFSRVNLPGTNILIKCGLSSNYLAYWRMLNKLTVVDQKIIEEGEVLDEESEKYLRDITEYLPSEDSDISYETYLNSVVPKTRILFDLMKDGINGKLSLHSIIDALEPFMIYQRDLSFKQYEQMTMFIIEKVKDFKKSYQVAKRAFEVLSTRGANTNFSPKLLTTFTSKREAITDIMEHYKLDKYPTQEMRDSEFLDIINSIDYGKFFFSMIGLVNSDLMIPNGMEQLNNTEEWIKQQTDDANADPQTEKCKTYVLAKKYLGMDELEEDNGKRVFFDKQYDKTFYDIAKEHEDELSMLVTRDQQIALLTEKLMSAAGLSEVEAKKDAEAMILKKRPVSDGDYAVVKLEEHNPPKMIYFIRKDNTWIRDEEINDNVTADKSKLFCNLTDNCISLNNSCDSNPTATVDIQKITVDKMVNEFVDSLKKNAEDIDTMILKVSENARGRLESLIRLKNENLIKYDKIKSALGGQANEVIIETSPYADTLSLILSQGDFVKRQHDIAKFVNYYTRPAGDDEDIWWLYCISTGVKLLPTFVFKLAEAFINGEDYFFMLRKIAAEQGDASGDGEAIIDKYSGWVITNIDFSTDEGFTAEGFVVKTREMLEADLGNAIAQAPNEEPEEYADPEANTILRVMKATSRFMGLDTSHIQDFVISETAKLLAKTMPAREDYEKAIAAAKAKGKKKKLDPYDIAYNQTLILVTLSFLLIGIQTSVPSLRTRKTYPGCVKSFGGYPCFGDSDTSGIAYIACVANGIKSSIEPWNAIRKLKPDKIVSKMTAMINKFILRTDLVQEKILAKQEYITHHDDEDIPADVDIKNWGTFLPPLRNVNIGTVAPITGEFESQLIQELKRGNKDQDSKINALRSKIIFLALSIEESIQKVVTNNIGAKQAILSNSAKVPFLENACCNDSDDNTHDYFAKREKTINTDNEMVRRLRNVLDDINIMSRASILFSPKDTRIIYPELPPEFDEETIYKAFIDYCRYNSDLPISEDLRAICMDKPEDFDTNASIEEQIAKLKRDGKNYNNDSLENLLAIINRNNIVNLDLHTLVFNNTQKIRDLLSSFEEKENTTIPQPFREKMSAIIDRFGVGDQPAKNGDSEEVRDFKNYLSTSNNQMQTLLSDFVRRNASKKDFVAFKNCIDSISNFKTTNEKHDSEVFNMSAFMKSAIKQIAKVYPNIIMNKVNYDSVKIPRHWKLSERHADDIKELIKKHYTPMTSFYDDEQLNQLLNIYQYQENDILNIAMSTVYMTPIMVNGVMIETVFDKMMTELLFRFYLLSLLVDMMELVDREELYTEKVERPSNPLLAVGIEEVDVALADGDAVPLLEIMAGEKKVMAQKVAGLLSAIMRVTCLDKDSIDYSYKNVMEKITRAKEKEKDMIVEYLTEMSDEERNIENMFKNHKIGRWSVGMQKGFTVYQGDTYDQERDAIEKRALLEMKLGKIDGVTEGLMDVFVMDEEMRMQAIAEIEAEEYDMGHIGEDNDEYGEEYDEM